MGWLILLGLVVVTGGLLWRFGRLPKGSLELVGAALLLGIAGYAWQGHPNAAGSPVAVKEQEGQGELMITAERRAMSGQFNRDGQLIDLSESFIRKGDTESAVGILNNAVRTYPGRVDLWVGLANALVEHGGGTLTPAAQYAFQKAADLSPQHPGPPFFFGLALARSGQLDKAGVVWRELLARTPPTASWRPDLEKRIAELDQAMASGGQ